MWEPMPRRANHHDLDLNPGSHGCLPAELSRYPYYITVCIYLWDSMRYMCLFRQQRNPLSTSGVGP